MLQVAATRAKAAQAARRGVSDANPAPQRHSSGKALSRTPAASSSAQSQAGPEDVADSPEKLVLEAQRAAPEEPELPSAASDHSVLPSTRQSRCANNHCAANLSGSSRDKVLAASWHF